MKLGKIGISLKHMFNERVKKISKEDVETKTDQRIYSGAYYSYDTGNRYTHSAASRYDRNSNYIDDIYDIILD
uniref:Uncharacterized protein n=1 Tax=Ignisphaera aggregans TaxID=334771 RepID=A0A7C2VAP8_9CREN